MDTATLTALYPPTIGEEAYTVDFRPLVDAYGDPDYSLSVFLHGLGAMLQQIDDISKDGPDGEPGWSQIFDLTRAKTEWLPWAGQIVGYSVPSRPDNQSLDEYDAIQRERIITRSAYRRGTTSLLREVLQEQLGGSQRVIIHERASGNAYWIDVWVYANEVLTSEAEVRRAALSQKAAGLLMDFRVLSEQSYELLFAESTSYQVVKDKFANYQEVYTNPGKVG